MVTVGISQQLEADLHTAQKTKDAFAVKVLRFLKANVDAAAKAKLRALSDEETLLVIRRRIKQSQEAIEKYQQGGRPELAAAEQREIELISRYLPPPLSDAELHQLVAETVTATGAASSRDFGRVMGAVIKQVAGRAEGARVKAAVEKALGEK